MITELKFVFERNMIDYGPDDLFVHLYHIYLFYETQEIMHEVMLFNEVAELREWRGHSLGQFSHIDEKNIFIHYYKNGAVCEGSLRHTSVVFLTCGASKRVIGVTTSKPCHHDFTVQTPVACLNDL